MPKMYLKRVGHWSVVLVELWVILWGYAILALFAEEVKVGGVIAVVIIGIVLGMAYNYNIVRNVVVNPDIV